jgi:hypothetical protein
MDLLERAGLLDELSGVLAATVDGGRVVLLAGEAGDTEAVLRYAPAAARQAAAVAAHREAVGHYRAVLAHADLVPPAARAGLLEAYSVECYLSGLSAEAVSARRAALELREAAGDRERVGEACAGCRACTGGTVTGRRPRWPPPGPSPSSRPCRPAGS